MKPAKCYSTSTGYEIFAKFRKNYPRATAIFQILTNHGKLYPVYLFCYDQEKWNRYKRIVKFIDKVDRSAEMTAYTKHRLSWIREELVNKWPELSEST